MRFLRAYLGILGIPRIVENRADRVIQRVSLILHVFAVTHSVTYFLQMRKRNASTYMATFSYVFESFYNAALYVWRLRIANFRNADFHNRSALFCVLTGTVFSSQVLILTICVLNCFWNGPQLGSLYPSAYGAAYLHLLEAAYMFVQIQRFAVLLDVAIVIDDTAKDIGTKNFGTCTLNELEEVCRNIKQSCAYLSDKLSCPITMMHTTYLLHLITDMPTHVAEFGFEIHSLCFLCEMIKNSIEVFLIVHAGDGIPMECKRLLREIKLREQFYGDSVREAHLFSKAEQTIRFGIGNSLTLKSCCYFLSLSLGFSLTTFQSAFSPSYSQSAWELRSN